MQSGNVISTLLSDLNLAVLVRNKKIIIYPSMEKQTFLKAHIKVGVRFQCFHSLSINIL